MGVTPVSFQRRWQIKVSSWASEIFYQSNLGISKSPSKRRIEVFLNVSCCPERVQILDCPPPVYRSDGAQKYNLSCCRRLNSMIRLTDWPPVLRHLRVNTRTLLEDNFAFLRCSDCILNGTDTVKTGKLYRIISARLRNLSSDDPNLAQINITKIQNVYYYTARAKDDPFPDLLLLDPSDRTQHADISDAVDAVRKSAKKHILTKNYESNIKRILRNHIDIVRL